MPYVKTNYAELFYEDIGEGEPVIFLHSSFSRGIISFSSQIADFQWVHRCIFPDFRGNGRSKCISESWTTPELADDVIAIMNSLEIEKAHIIGHSLGGDVSYYLAINYPDRVGAVISIGSTGFINETVLESANQYEPNEILRGNYENWIKVMQANHVESTQGDWITLVKQTISNWRNFPKLSTEQLNTISAPFMLLYGSEDGTVKAKEISHLEEQIVNFKSVSIEGCGHRLHMIEGKPTVVNKILLEFLRDCSILSLD